MADISEVKVSGVTYNIKDSIMRNNIDATQIVCFWDGNTEGLECIEADSMYKYYRVSDAIEMTNDQSLIGNSATLHLGLSNGNTSSEEGFSLDQEAMYMAMMPTLLGVNLGPANMIDSSCNMQENSEFGQICLQMFGSDASEELKAELLELTTSGIQIGLNLQSRLVMYINAPHECTFTHLAEFLYGIESLTIPAGLWLAKLENSTGTNSFIDSAFIDTMYLASPHFSKIINHGLGIIFMMLESGMLVNTSNLSLFKSE